ncbi:MAG: peptidoglycan DD-metalloendopeptidase family protein [Candidatus Paceibacterota bacterium]
MRKLLSISLILIVSFFLAGQVNAQEDVGSLRERIEEQNFELEELQEERERLEQQLQSANATSNALQREINNIDYQINQLDVSIRTNRVIINRLSLEAQALTNEIITTEENIKNRKKAIGDLLVQLQQIDNENLLTILLKNDSLSESVSAMQSIMNLGNTLTGNITQLRELQDDLSSKVQEVRDNQRQIEIEQDALVNSQNLMSQQQSQKEYLLNLTVSEKLAYEREIAQIDQRQEEISAIIEKIEYEIRASFNPDLLPLERPGVLGFPVQDIFVTQCYGKTDFAAGAYRTGNHIGVDFRAPIGTPMLASESGVITAIDDNDVSSWQKYQFGKYIIIEHDNRLSSIYAHLSSFNVNVGDRVEKGQIIGYSGNTGYSTGPHLHFGVYATPPGGWNTTTIRDGGGGLMKISPAAGLVPVGIHVDPSPYLPNHEQISKCL